MRHLTLKRAKSFVACLAKVRVYVEDPTATDVVINQISCRKLGDLKNGEEKTFEIGEETVKVFVIADRMSKGYCNEFYQIPAGEEDVFLSGQNKFNPATGNAFQFDNNNSPEVLQNRKKSMKKGIVVLCVAIAVGFVGGIVGGKLATALLSQNQEVEAKTFSSNGMSVTLTNEFQKESVENYTLCYASEKVGMLALKEPFTLAEGMENYTLEQYGNLVLKNNKLTVALETVDGLTGFSYDFTNSDTGDCFTYVCFVYKSGDAFWLVQFFTKAEHAEEYESQIVEWAKSVDFKAQ